MPLTKKGKKIKKSFKKQYGKDADKVFYASANKGTLKGVIKKLRRGSTGFEGSPELGGQGTRTSTTYGGGGGGDGNGQASTTKNIKTKSTNGGSTARNVLNVVGKGVLDVTGLGYVIDVGKNVVKGVKSQQNVIKERKTDPLGGEMMTTRNMYRPYAPTVDTGGDSEDYSTKVLKKPIPTAKKATDSFSASGFFPFKAYKSGGVRFGPPPKRGPNPLVPPVKMRTGGRGTCPHRPDGIKGVGKAIKGFKFIGVK